MIIIMGYTHKNWKSNLAPLSSYTYIEDAKGDSRFPILTSLLMASQKFGIKNIINIEIKIKERMLVRGI